MSIDLEKDLVWHDISEGYPQPDSKVVIHSQGVYTGHYETGKGHPPKGQWIIDKVKILEDTRYAYVDDEYFEKIQKEYW